MAFVNNPWPVLQPAGTDYNGECSFDIISEAEDRFVDGDNLVFRIAYELECPGLEAMLREGDARVCLIAHSAKSSFRRSFAFPDGEHVVEVRINKFDVADSVEFSGLILAKTPIDAFSLPDFNPDFFENVVFKIGVGDMLAESNQLSIDIDDSDLEKPVTSIFRIVSGDAGIIYRPYFDSDFGTIDIHVSQEFKALYSRIDTAYATTMRRPLTCVVTLPALVEAVGLLQNKSDETDVTGYRWAKVITRKLEAKGYVFDDDGHLDSSVSAAEAANDLLGGIVGDTVRTFEEILKQNDYADGAEEGE